MVILSTVGISPKKQGFEGSVADLPQLHLLTVEKKPAGQCPGIPFPGDSKRGRIRRPGDLDAAGTVGTASKGDIAGIMLGGLSSHGRELHRERGCLPRRIGRDSIAQGPLEFFQ